MSLTKFNTEDRESLYALMDDCKENPDKYKFPFFGANEDGEYCKVEIYEDRILVETTQHNDWIRKNWYYRDGMSEELYDGSLIREKAVDDGSICPCCGQYIPPKLRKQLPPLALQNDVL